MTVRSIAVALALLVAASLAAQRASAQHSDGRRGDWVELKCQSVAPGIDHDTILLAPGKGLFRAVRVRVEKNDAVLRHLQVVYENGAADKFEIGHRIRAGGESRQLDFADGPHAIKRINLAYSPIADLSGPAQVCADGLEDAGY